MTWQIEFSETAIKQFARLDHQVKKEIQQFLRKRLATEENPRRFGAPLRRNLSGLWKYRIGDYRVMADIQDERIVIVIVKIGHRSKVYGGH